MKKIRASINKIIEAILAFLMAVLTLDVLWQVFTRYVLNDPSPWSEELARFILIWVSILGAAYVSGRKEHIAIDLLQQKSSPKNRRKIQWVIDTMIILFALFVLVIGGYNLVQITISQTSSSLQIPLGVIYLIIPISGVLIIFYALTDMIAGEDKRTAKL